MISPIGEPGTTTHRCSNQTLKYLIRPAAEACGYIAKRADEDTRPGIITNQVIQRVADADLVVADLTDYNPNVFYELAIRHALQRPLVQLMAREHELPFDVAGMRTVFFDIHDLDSVETAKRELGEHIEALDADPTRVQTPISVARDVKQLWESSEPLAKVLGDLVSRVDALQADQKEMRGGGPARTAGPRRRSSPAFKLTSETQEILRQALQGSHERALRDLREYANRPIDEQEADSDE